MTQNKNLIEYITKEDIGLAYKKAKVDLFYSPRICREEIVEFESRLPENLESIYQRILSLSPYEKFANWWTVVPHGIEFNLDKIPKSRDVIDSDPKREWDETAGEVNRITFRLMENSPIDFHVLSALWIIKIGSKFDEKLSSAARGNRLRRDKNGQFNIFSLGSTLPYLNAYCKWRDDAFSVMEASLDSGKNLATITTDINSFYHKLDVRFLANKEFIKSTGIILSTEEVEFNNYYVGVLHSWAKASPLGIGLPVGLTASSIIANLALAQLDRVIEESISPLYYGRYVDDIIIVFENTSKIKTLSSAWDYLISKSGGILRRDKRDESIQINCDHLVSSDLKFGATKTKLFLLSGTSGKSILNSIKQTIASRTSEWRALPNLPDDEVAFEANLLNTIQKDGTSVDSLRKADRVSIRRAEFAITLRDIESYARALAPSSWKLQRQAFLDAFTKHIVALPTFFEYFNYLPRVIAIACSCGDFESAFAIFKRIEAICDQLDPSKCTIKGLASNRRKDLLRKFRSKLTSIIYQSIIASIPSRLTKEEHKSWSATFEKGCTILEGLEFERATEKAVQYLICDVAYQPLKANLLPKSIKAKNFYWHSKELLSQSQTSYDEYRSFLNKEILRGVRISLRIVRLHKKSSAFTGLIFPTRPFGMQEIYFLVKPDFTSSQIKIIQALMLCYRGFRPTDKLPHRIGDSIHDPILISHPKRGNKKLKICVVSWMTSIDSWTASIVGMPDPDLTRFNRLNHLLNSIMKTPNTPDYVVFPELSIPSSWFLSIANKLRRKGINLISGIEYLRFQHPFIANQVWCALSDDSLGFPSLIIYRQDKQKPAIHEESEIWSTGGKILARQFDGWSKKSPPIIIHGDFAFSILVCSELTNPNYRASLSGKIDALFVPEWNQDLNGFASLIEASALDIHAYIIQCNDRKYGDSRIRSPYAEDYRRDVIRIKGGIDDYFVTGEIQTKQLREFQSHYRSPKGPYKPVPDSFKPAGYRRALPRKKDAS